MWLCFGNKTLQGNRERERQFATMTETGIKYIYCYATLANMSV